MAAQNLDFNTELQFELLPGFTQFILDKKLEHFTDALIRNGRKLDIPLLQYFSHMTDTEFREYFKKTAIEYLTYLANNQAREQLEISITNWKKNQLVGINQDQIVLDDLFLVSRMRKMAFTEMLRLFTTDVDKVFLLMEELDRLFLAFERETSATYIDLLHEHIQETNYFKEKLSETSPGFYYTYDIVNDRQIQKTEKLFLYLGYSYQDFENDEKFFRKLVHKDDICKADQYINDIRNKRDNEVHFIEYRLLDASGNYRWMRNYESVYKTGKDGKAEQILGVAFDITNERFIGEELKLRETELLEAQEVANMGSFRWDMQNNTSFRTQQTNIILGLKESERMSDFMDKVYPADRKLVDTAIQTAIKTDGIYDCEYRISVDGMEKTIWARGLITYNKEEPVLMKGTIMDVTKKHQTLMKLRKSEELYKQAQVLNKLGNWTWEIDTNTFDWSDEMYRIFGLPGADVPVTLELFNSLVHPDDREKMQQFVSRQKGEKHSNDDFFRIITPGGIEKVIYAQSQLFGADDRSVVILGTCQDVTEQKELENSLYKKTQQLERSNSSLEEFAYISSHDLKEPLRKVSMFIDKFLFSNLDNLDVKSREIIEKIILATSRMQRMVDEILALSQISAEQTFNRISLNTIIQEAVSSLDSKIEENKAELRYRNLPEVFVNGTQFRQLFVNLITNSIKFKRSDVAPEIDISHHYLNGQKIKELGLDSGKKYLMIIYRDNGIGFESSSAKKIFTIFHRLHNKEQFEGTGIGLAICKKIAEHHLGTIDAIGTPGQGAEFRIVIPG